MGNVGSCCGSLDVVRYLTEERHCDPLAKGFRDLHAVSFATIAGKVDIVKYFVEERRCDLEASGEYEYVLRLALRVNSLEVFQFLSSITTSSSSKLYFKPTTYDLVLL